MPADRPQPPRQSASASSRRWRPASPATTAASRARTASSSEMLLREGYATFAVGKWHLTLAERRLRRVQGALAALARLRALLRLPRRQDQPVGADPRPRQPLHRPAERARRELPPERRPRGPGHRVRHRSALGRAGQAVLPLLLPRRRPLRRTTSSASGSRSTAASSIWAGTAGARRSSRGRSRRASCRRTRSFRRERTGCPAWDTLSADEQRLYARQMEVYAAFLEQTDHHIGRVIDFLDEIGGTRQHPDLPDLGQRR